MKYRIYLQKLPPKTQTSFIALSTDFLSLYLDSEKGTPE